MKINISSNVGEDKIIHHSIVAVFICTSADIINEYCLRKFPILVVVFRPAGRLDADELLTTVVAARSLITAADVIEAVKVS